MAKKKVTSSASVKKTTTPQMQPAKPASEPAQARKRKLIVRKPPMVRALNRVRLLDQNASRLLKLVKNWRGEQTKDQRSTNADIVAGLNNVTEIAAKILLDVDMLAKSGFAPTAGRGNAHAPLDAGTRVVLKETQFATDLYGDTNDFEVVVDNGKHTRISDRNNPRAPQLVVPRSYLVIASDEAEDESETDDDNDDDDDDDDDVA